MRKILLLGLVVALAGCGEPKTEKKKEADGKEPKTSQTAPPESNAPVAAATKTETPEKATDVAATAPAEESKKSEEAKPQQDSKTESTAAKNPDAARDQEVAQSGDQETEPEKQPQVSDIMKQFTTDRNAFMQKYRAAKPADRQALVENELPKPQAYAEKMLPLVQAEPDTEATRTGLLWMLSQSTGEPKQVAADLLIEHHMDSEELPTTIYMLSRQAPTQDAQGFLDRLQDKATDDQLRLKVIAAYAKVMQLHNSQRQVNYLKEQVESAQNKEDNESDLAQAKSNLDDFMATLSDAAKVFYETGKMENGQELPDVLEAMSNEHGDVVLMERGDRKTLLKDSLKGTIFEMRYLSIGKVAPDIAGEDLDGEEFKLSDYRGKVVVLDFWGDW